MSRIFFAITFIWLLSFVSSAQTSNDPNVNRPNFTGTWEFENKKSSNTKSTMVIKHEGDELIITESRVFEGKPILNKTILYSDKRGERNVLLMPGADFETEVKSTTSWKKGKLVRNGTFSSYATWKTERYRVAHHEIESYRLSEDGNLLTVQVIARSEVLAGVANITRLDSGKRVYRRTN